MSLSLIPYKFTDKCSSDAQHMDRNASSRTNFAFA